MLCEVCSHYFSEVGGFLVYARVTHKANLQFSVPRNFLRNAGKCCIQYKIQQRCKLQKPLQGCCTKSTEKNASIRVITSTGINGFDSTDTASPYQTFTFFKEQRIQFSSVITACRWSWIYFLFLRPASHDTCPP